MDGYSGQRAVSGLAISKRGSSPYFRDPNHEDRSIRYCNRLGCSTRPNPLKSSNAINLDKAKYSKPSLHSTSSKTAVGISSSSTTAVGSSSKSLVVKSNLRKHHREHQNPASLKEVIVAENSCEQGELEAVESIPSTTEILRGQTEPENAVGRVCHGLSTTNSTEDVGNTRPQKKNQQSAFVNRDTSMGFPIRHSFSSRNTDQVVRPQNQGSNAHRYGLRNIGCASISDVFPSGSLSDYSRRRINMIKRRCASDGESSARGKKPVESSSGASSQRNTLSSPSSSSTDRLTSQLTSRTKNWSAGSSSVASVRTQRTISGDTSMMRSKSDSDNTVSMPEHLMIPRLPQAELSINESATGGLSRSFPTELPSVCQNSFRRPGSSSGHGRRRPIARPEDNSTQPFHSFSVDRDGFRRFNMEGIAEVLFALERIEQDEELTYEQLLVLESNLLLGGLTFHDQHRDMRLDIDNMSYEELLALEEKMGTVSTALTEEQLLKCLRRSHYMPPPLRSGIVGHENDDDTKCSICQEEYMVGDEMGMLGCEHRYHVECIDQWLRQKNWCPICKASVAPSGPNPAPVAGGANHFV